jgi:hypothetical protein
VLAGSLLGAAFAAGAIIPAYQGVCLAMGRESLAI